MKTPLMIILLILSSVCFASEKTLEITAHVVRMTSASGDSYRLELREYAAVYSAGADFADCLEESVKNKKAVTLKVTASSLNVLACKVN